MPCTRIARRTLAGLAAAALLTASHAADNWPAKPIRIIVPTPPAGPSDIAVRPLAAAVQKALGQAVIVENRAGANGNIGAAEVARAPADGYTWLWAMDPVLTVNKHIYKNIGYSSDAIVVLNAAARFSQTLICNPGLGFKSVKDMLEAAKSRELTYATGGAGSPGHLVMESLLSGTGVKMVHVPYKGPAPAMQDLMGGQVDCGFLAAPTVLPQIQSGRVTALATTGARARPCCRHCPRLPSRATPISTAPTGCCWPPPRAFLPRSRSAFSPPWMPPSARRSSRSGSRPWISRWWAAAPSRPRPGCARSPTNGKRWPARSI
jgi:tripartite-type tricarboxylate transporter receptor subunit TctC